MFHGSVFRSNRFVVESRRGCVVCCFLVSAWRKFASNFPAREGFQNGGEENSNNYSEEKIYFFSKCREEWKKLTKTHGMSARDVYSAFHGIEDEKKLFNRVFSLILSLDFGDDLLSRFSWVLDRGQILSGNSLGLPSGFALINV